LNVVVAAVVVEACVLAAAGCCLLFEAEAATKLTPGPTARDAGLGTAAQTLHASAEATTKSNRALFIARELGLQ
jgi:hypothetical protein